VSRGALWTARVLSALGVLFLLFDATIKVAMIQPVIDSAATLGVPVELMFPIGILELILLALYLIPSTSVARSGAVDRFPGRLDPDAAPSGESLPGPRPVPELHRGLPVGWSVPPQGGGSRRALIRPRELRVPFGPAQCWRKPGCRGVELPGPAVLRHRRVILPRMPEHDSELHN
jgi:DoxX-like family